MAEGLLSSSTHDVDDDDAESLSARYMAALKFPDDFAEFQARADSGGSTYGMLKRHAFAQQSLRVVSPSDPEVDVIVPQRRAHSLIPPTESRATTTHDVVDQKMIIAVLCSDPSPRQQRRHRYHHHHHKRQQQHHSNQQKHQQSEQPTIKKMDTLQLPTDFYCVRRHSAGSTPSDSSSTTTASWPIRRRSLQQAASSPATVVDGRGSTAYHGDVDTLEGGCRRRSFSVTPKGDVVNEGDEILPRQDVQCTNEARSRVSTGVDDEVDPVTDNNDEEELYRVLLLGGPGVGKTAIAQQFLTSEYMAAQNTSFDDGQEIKVPVLLNGTESVMEFIDLPYSGDADLWRDYAVDGYIVVYSITDRRSFQKAMDVVADIRQHAKRPNKSQLNKPLLLVANKSDLERARVVAR